VFYAGKMVEKKNGAVVRDVTTTETETGNVYVVAPVPASVQAAIKVGVAAAEGRLREDRAADRQDDPDAAAGYASRPVGQLELQRLDRQLHDGRRPPPRADAEPDTNRQDNQTYDFELYSPSRFGNTGRPVYKPEHWDKVIELDMWTNKYDPVMTCQPLGVPRPGPPRRIIQSENDVLFLYAGGDAGGGYGEYRVIPTDNRKHDPQRAIETTYLGYTVGRWEGDTLVLDAIAFVDTTWLGRGGFFHSPTCAWWRSSRARATSSL
jgi:hypothetical protein